ncbi:histone-like nucleoid-structuring protein Lsr2 [Streptomyces sp. NPDC012825]|uniref:Lsr2 family DNA-binding protein n=1 Tax=Streptomyces sp. NPDC012825 TaxID=3364851 RepID=UPI003688D50F
MTSIEDLTQLAPPPAGPAPSDWRAVEATLGMTLPHDYKRLADTYGPGAFCDFVRVYHPHGATEWVDLTGPMPARLRRQLLKDRESGTYSMPHPPEDLFAVGVTDNGNHLFWVTDPAADPDSWRLAVNEADGHDWYTHDGNLTEFLVSVLSGRTRVPVFPERLLDGGVFFTPSPSADRDHRPDRPSAPASIDSRAVREWARAHGYDVPDHGRVPAEIVRAWQQDR